MANDLKDNHIKSFALDRLTNLEITRRDFQQGTGFDVTEHFKYCFGIISPNDDKPQEIILSFNSFHGKYIKSLPLHESQQVIIDNEEELQVKLTLFVTHDFFMELLSFGANLKVIKPISLINDLKNTFKSVLEQYN